MTQMFDPEAVKTVIEGYQKRHEHHINEPGYDGVAARLGASAWMPLVLWRVAEANRGSDTYDVVVAMIRLFSGEVGACIKAHIREEEYPRIIAMLLGQIRDELINVVHAPTDDGAMIPKTEIGVA